MPGKKEINADLELKGKLIIHTVPVATGTGVFVYNSTSKELGQRTYTQFISDLDLLTVTSATSTYYSRSQLQTSGQSRVSWGNLVDVPSTFPATAHNHNKLESNQIGPVNINNLIEQLDFTYYPAIYDENNGSTNLFPTVNNANGILSVSTWVDNNFGHQIGFSSNGNLYHNHKTPYNWDGWKQIWTSKSFTQVNIDNWNTAFGWGNHAGLYAAASHEHDRTYITDSRGAARLPSYYDDRYAQWDFQNKTDTGALGDEWHGVLTVAKWTNYEGGHRQEQLFFTGDDLKRRTATSETTWGTVKTIWDSGNLSPVTTNTGQIITDHKVFLNGVGDEYYNAGIEIRRDVAGKFPTLGFHQPADGYAGTIRLKPGAFEFRGAGNEFITLRASGYVVSGASNAGFLKAGGEVDYTTYAVNNGVTTWEAASRGLIHNVTIPGHTLNNQNRTVSLQEATQGTVSGILNSASTAAGNPTDHWYHRLKMLHANPAGYYTEIAVQMTGGTSMWFKTFEGGTIRNRNNVNGWTQVVDVENEQIIRGQKSFQEPVKLYDPENDGYGYIRLTDGSFAVRDTYDALALEASVYYIRTGVAVLGFGHNTQARNYTFPNKSGTVALLDDLSSTVVTITASTYTVQENDANKLIIFTAPNVVVTVNNSSLNGNGSAVQFEFVGTGTLTCVGSGAQILVNKNRAAVSDGINSTMVLQRLTTTSSSKFKFYGELV